MDNELETSEIIMLPQCVIQAKMDGVVFVTLGVGIAVVIIGIIIGEAI